MGTRDLIKRTYWLTIGSSLLCFILGLLVFLEADIAVKTVAVILGVLLVIIGVAIIIRYFSDGAMRYLFGYSLLYALLDVIAGLTMIINPSIMMIIIAIFVTISLLIEFITKIQVGLLFKQYGVSGWFAQLLLGFLLLICAIVIIMNPVDGTLVITKVVATIIMVASLLNLVDCLVIKEKAKDLKKSLKDIFD